MRVSWASYENSSAILASRRGDLRLPSVLTVETQAMRRGETRLFTTPIPVSDPGWLPNRVRVLGHLRKVRQTLALYARPPYLSRTAHRSRLVEGGIQPQAGHQGDRISQLTAAIEEHKRDRLRPLSRAVGASALASRATARPTRLCSCAACPARRHNGAHRSALEGSPRTLPSLPDLPPSLPKKDRGRGPWQPTRSPGRRSTKYVKQGKK
jgi:hypothetical protein